jgi:phospholipid transport system transporter-binding protein
MDGGTLIDGVLHLSGTLTFATVGGQFRACGPWFSETSPVTALDLSGVESVDSAGLALLLEWQSMFRQRGMELTIRNAPSDLLRLAALAEASGLLGLPPAAGPARC